MADKKEDSKLTRMSLGGIGQIPSFTGSEDDYLSLGWAIFEGQKGGEIIRERSTETITGFKINQRYNPHSADSFLRALNGVLENQRVYLVYCMRDLTHFRQHQRVEGYLYALHGERREVSKG